MDIKGAASFTKEAAQAAVQYVTDFCKGLWQHIESVAILTLGSIGLSALLGELPFWMTLPAWIETPMVIPVISVTIILALMKLAERRNIKRNAATV